MHLMSLVSPVDNDLAVVYSRLLPAAFRTRCAAWLPARGGPGRRVRDDGDECAGAGTARVRDAGRQSQDARRPRDRGRGGARVRGTEISLKGGGGPTCLTRPLGASEDAHIGRLADWQIGRLRSQWPILNTRWSPSLGVDEFIDVLRRSTLAERRPVDDARTMAGMLAHADVIVTARDARRLLVGVSRAITDFSYCTYLSDLAVDVAFQRQGIGRELIRRTHVAAGLKTSLILLAAPKAETYYPHIGMLHHNSCWRIERQ